MKKLSLNGRWQLKQAGKEEKIQAEVPGCVHTDLIAAGVIDDPFYRNNEEKLMWIGEKGWDYSREFNISSEFLNKKKIILNCQGLDTLADIYVNDCKIVSTNNMYREWELEVKKYLHKGKNKIKIHFKSPFPYLREKNQKFHIPAWSVGEHRLYGGGWLRKQPSNFGWDWGPKLVTMGIWKDIELIALDTARIKEVKIEQKHLDTGEVKVKVAVELEKLITDNIKGKLIFDLEDQILVEKELIFAESATEIEFIVKEPKLWWPNGMGDQHLYEIKVNIFGKSGRIIDNDNKKIGLRELKLLLEDDEWGQSFKFAANGVEFFAKGANWIPADAFVTRVSDDDYRRVLEDAVEANMNMLRVWGGGIYESDKFYELCDQLGITVWQDFIFACGAYPAFDEEFMINVRVEARQNVKRIRHHASLALWCGNNEIEQGIAADEWDPEKIKMDWNDYKKLFDELLPDIVAEHDPQTDYWPGSPHSPKGDRNDFYNPRWGDAHIWDVWHGKKPFEWYRNCEHRFNSEFGFQSFPEPKTVYGYTEKDDRNITSYVMEHHQRSGIGNTTIIQYMLEWFKLPHDFDNILWVSQILQGLGVKYAVEHWRRGMPRGMGTLYWQLNDNWPVASWSSIDYHGYWKALHYMAKKFYAPVIISGVEDNDDFTVEIHVTSDSFEDLRGEVSWQLRNIAGDLIKESKFETKISSRSNNYIKTLDLSREVEKYGIRDLILWPELRVEKKVIADNFVSFVKPKHMQLLEPEIKYTLEKLRGGKYKIELEAKHTALWTWLEMKKLNVKFSDNFFHLYPGRKIYIEMEIDKDISITELKDKLNVNSLFDTY